MELLTVQLFPGPRSQYSPQCPVFKYTLCSSLRMAVFPNHMQYLKVTVLQHLSLQTLTNRKCSRNRYLFKDTLVILTRPQYSDQNRGWMTEEPGFSLWEEKRFLCLQSIQTGCGAYPDICSLDNWGCLSGGRPVMVWCLIKNGDHCRCLCTPN